MLNIANEFQIKAAYKSLANAKSTPNIAYDECSSAMCWMYEAWLLSHNISPDTGHGWASIRQQFMDNVSDNIKHATIHLDGQCITLKYILDGAEEDPENSNFNVTEEEFLKKSSNLIQSTEDWLHQMKKEVQKHD